MKVISFKGGMDRNLSYLIYNEEEAIIIDPFKNIDIYLKKARSLGVKIVGFLNTHQHRDHIEGNEDLEEKGIKNLKNLKNIKQIKTPGHSEDSVCFLVDNNLFTGDVLFVNRVGMTKTLENTKIFYKSLKKLKKLNKTTKVYPGHYYNSKFPTTIGKELKNNPYLKAKNFMEFKKIMDKWREYTISYHERRKK
tara:strand:- start:141 stop:719 length:579 start_codon:yes stop_codon:yes gene_type:complete